MAAVLVLAGCVGQGADIPQPSARQALRVTNAGQPFANFEGAAARKMAEGKCEGMGKRLVPSIYDRYEAGAWVYVEGCA